MEFKAEQKNGWDELKNNWITVKIVEAKIKKTSYWFVDWLVALSTCIDALTSKDEKNITNTEMQSANQKAREFSRYLHHLQKLQKPLLNDWTCPPAHKCINFGSKGIPKHRLGFELGTDHYLSPEGGWEGDELEVLGLNKVKFSRSPLRMLLHWSDPP